MNTINSLTSFKGLNISEQVMKKINKSPKEQKNIAMLEIEAMDTFLDEISEDVCVFKPTKKNDIFIRAKENDSHPQRETKVNAKKFIKNPSVYIIRLLKK